MVLTDAPIGTPPLVECRTDCGANGEGFRRIAVGVATADVANLPRSVLAPREHLASPGLAVPQVPASCIRPTTTTGLWMRRAACTVLVDPRGGRDSTEGVFGMSGPAAEHAAEAATMVLCPAQLLVNLVPLV